MTTEEFEALLSDCLSALRRFVYYKTPSKTDGDDVLQETLLAAYSHRGTVRNADSFKAWLLRIAANKCSDFYRARAGSMELPLDEVPESALVQSRYGLTTAKSVRETLNMLDQRDSQILRLFYMRDLPQAEIARMLGIPAGTVKSRLHAARQRFKSAYPHPPASASKGAENMTKLPEILPEYAITKSDEAPFPVKWEELMGWLIVPRLGERLSWAMYDYPGRTRSEIFDMEVICRASVHGIEGVEVVSRERNTGNAEHKNGDITRTLVAQLTDTHCRILAESHTKDDVKYFYTFLDADDFLPNWGFGEDNRGNEVDLCPKGIIRRDGDTILTSPLPFLLDVVGRYTVSICGKAYDCVCVMDVNTYNPGIVSEQFLDKNGKTVLWRRFNRDDWAIDRYKQRWSEKLPDNARLSVNGETYVHWYDCVSDYVM